MSTRNTTSPRLLFIAVCLIAVLILAPRFRSLYAQDVPTETPTETATLTATWTETSTSVPTDTATETATETPTETAAVTETATPTAEIIETESPTSTLVETPSATATSEIATPPSPSPTATASATLTAFGAEPALTELFADNFDTGELYLWTLGNGWALAESEGGLALQSADSDEAVTFVHNTLSDVSVQARFQFETGMVRLSVRQSDSGTYTVVLDSNGQVLLQRGSEYLGAAIVIPNTPGIWRTVRLSAIGDIIRVVVDGTDVIAAQDTVPLPQGTISFAGIGISGLKADDFIVEIPSSELALPGKTFPTEELQPTFTPLPDDGSQVNQRSGTTLLVAGTIFLDVSNTAGLIQAVNTANADTNNTYVIRLASNTYTLTDDQQGFVSFLKIVQNAKVIIVGIESYNLGIPPYDPALPSNRKAIIQRGDNEEFISVFNVKVGGSLTLYNVVIRNGGGPGAGPTPPINSGGGIVNSNVLNIYNSLIADNTSYINAGGILNNPSAQLVIRNVVFRNNKTLNRIYSLAGGGAIGNKGGTITSACTTFDTNDAKEGGAIYNGLFGDGGSISLEKANFLNNIGNLGKAIRGENGTVTITGNVHWEPTSDANTIQFGGAITPIPNTIVNGITSNLTCYVPPLLSSTPTWGQDGIPVQFNQPMPILSTVAYGTCDTSIISEAQNLSCAVASYNAYSQQLVGNSDYMTWGYYMALVISAEGQEIMVGNIDQSGTLVYGNPLVDASDRCARFFDNGSGTDTGTFTDKAKPVSGSDVLCAQGIQRHFPWAVGEWIFQECAKGLGYNLGDYRRSGIPFNGNCNEVGFAAFLQNVEGLYTDPLATRHDPYLYLQRSQYELNLWVFDDSADPLILRHFGECPCSWGNVSGGRPPRPVDQVGFSIPPNIFFEDPQYGRYTPNQHSWSYYYDHSDAEDYDYFRVE